MLVEKNHHPLHAAKYNKRALLTATNFLRIEGGIRTGSCDGAVEGLKEEGNRGWTLLKTAEPSAIPNNFHFLPMLSLAGILGRLELNTAKGLSDDLPQTPTFDF